MSQISQFSSTGISGLDTLLRGGLIPGNTYLAQGKSGTGKSVLGQEFLHAGLDNGESVVYIHGEESREDILANADRIGINLRDADFLDIGAGSDFFAEDISYELLETSDIDSERFTEDIKQLIEETDPDRVLLDPVTQLRYVERDEHVYRKRLQSFIRFLRERETTAIVTRTYGQGEQNDSSGSDIESLSDGIIHLERAGNERRISVLKHRGIGQMTGKHGLEIRDDGMVVFPRLIPQQYNRVFDPSLLSTGNDDLDALLGGGIERGTVTMISGQTGIGKSSLGAQILSGVLDNGGTAFGYLFEESVDQFTYRSEKLGIFSADQKEHDNLWLREVEPMTVSAEEFGGQVLDNADEHEPDAVFIDGLGGYKSVMQGDDQRLINRIHALTRVLKNRGSTIFLTDELDDLRQVSSATSTRTSYLADNILLLTFLEHDRELLRAIGVLKKRLGSFASRFHRLEIMHQNGITITDDLPAGTDVLQRSSATGASSEVQTDS